MAFARHNIEKRRLIDLVRLNPILWDCRLPHYKRSDKKKAIKWNELGRIFSVNGERVQRTFTSLREIFRRELNHEKMLGSRFKSKWEYYDAMAFLKEVIRERKSRERIKTSDSAQLQQEHNQQQHNNNSSAIDEYQYFAPNDPNNPNNQQQQQQQQQLQQALQLVAQNVQDQPQKQQQQQQQTTTTTPPILIQQPPMPLQPDVILSLNSNTLANLQKLHTTPTNTNGLPILGPHSSPQALSSSRSGSTSPSIYIKDEPDSQDDTISLSSAAAPTNDKLNSEAKSQRQSRKQRKHYNVKLRSPTKSKTLDSNTKNLIIDENGAEDYEEDDDDDELPDMDADADLDEDDPDVDMLDDRLSRASTMTLAKNHQQKQQQLQQQQQQQQQLMQNRQPTAREILYTKFGDFLAARLNTLHETIANDLMNKILLLIAEK